MREPPAIIPILALLTLADAGRIYHVGFEDGTHGNGRAETEAGGHGGGVITVVDNPAPGLDNPSRKVARCETPAGYNRAEFTSPRFATAGKTYVYKWSYLVPADFHAGLDIKWMFLSQWKTWPCSDGDGWGAEICGTGGIYNDIEMKMDKSMHFRWRAEPACESRTFPFNTGEWTVFQEEIKWSNGQDGYYKLWMNGKVVRERRNIKTLLDRFDPGRCDIYWAVGLYGLWENKGKARAGIYVDNLEIWDTAHVEGIIGSPPTGLSAVRGGSPFLPAFPPGGGDGNPPWQEAGSRLPSFTAYGPDGRLVRRREPFSGFQPVLAEPTR